MLVDHQATIATSKRPEINKACPTISPLDNHQICRFRIMFTASIPGIVRDTEAKRHTGISPNGVTLARLDKATNTRRTEHHFPANLRPIRPIPPSPIKSQRRVSGNESSEGEGAEPFPALLHLDQLVKKIMKRQYRLPRSFGSDFHSIWRNVLIADSSCGLAWPSIASSHAGCGKVRLHPGFKAFVSEIDEGIEVSYWDKEGREIHREVFAGVKDYRLKQDHIDAQLKKFWEHRIDSN